MDLLVAPGTLLLAGADMLDPNFMHSVVLIGQHSAEGAYGLVLNRPSSQTTRSLLSDTLALGRLDAPIFVGGPVGLDTLQVLHREPGRIAGATVQLAEDLWIGGDLEQVGEYLLEAGPATTRVRLLLGYAGWGEGQLETELADGAWLPVPGPPGELLDGPPEQMWRTLVRRLGPTGRGLADQPPDPSWN
jgi:putative transcriptional regulator